MLAFQSTWTLPPWSLGTSVIETMLGTATTNTHAAPAPLLSTGPPVHAVLPSADTATELPCFAAPTAPVPTGLAPCCLHTPPLRMYTHAAPALLSSEYPPTTAVSPSADT